MFMSGKLIVIEGLDGSGKATQTECVFDYLINKKINCRRISFPNYDSPSSALVKMYLGGEFSDSPGDVNAYAASAFYAVDRCAGFLKDWKADYDNGCLLLADRYATSNAIYQMGKLDEAERDSFLDWTEDFEYRKLGVPKPDLVIYLDMSVEVSQKLMSKRYHGDESKKDIHECNVEFLRECRSSAMYAAKRLGWVVVKCDDGVTPRSIDDISRDIQKIIDNMIDRC